MRGANHDVPELATPIVLDAMAVAAARPLRIARLDIPFS